MIAHNESIVHQNQLCGVMGPSDTGQMIPRVSVRPRDVPHVSDVAVSCPGVCALLGD